MNVVVNGFEFDMSENRLCLRLQRGCGMRAGGVMLPHAPFRGRALFSLLRGAWIPYVLTWDDNTARFTASRARAGSPATARR